MGKMKVRQGRQTVVGSCSKWAHVLCALLFTTWLGRAAVYAETAQTADFQMELPEGWEFQQAKQSVDPSSTGVSLLGKAIRPSQATPVVKVLKFEVPAGGLGTASTAFDRALGKMLASSIIVPLVEAGHEVKSMETSSSKSPLCATWSGAIVTALDGKGTFRTAWRDYVKGIVVIRLVWQSPLTHSLTDWELIEGSFAPRFSGNVVQAVAGEGMDAQLIGARLPDPEADRQASTLVSQFGDSLLVVKGKQGAGSGFFCKDAQGTGVYTNIHVAVGEKGLIFKDIRGRVASVGASKAAGDRDIVRFDCPEAPNAPLELVEDFDSTVHIGDPIVVLGNPDGAGVVKPLSGKVVAVGPDLVEVDAEFIPGNSGSPIIHVASGRVIGIATYLIVQKVDSLKNKRPETDIRRFGYRIDGVKAWQSINWQIMYEDAAVLAGVEELTDGLIAFLKDIGADDRINKGPYRHPALRRPVDDFLATVNRSSLSETDHRAARQRLVLNLRTACVNDIAVAKPKLRYDYSKRGMETQDNIRAALKDVFEELFAAQ